MRIFFVLFFFFFPLFFSQAANLIKEEAETHREEGYRLQAEGDLTGAMLHYQKAIGLDPLYIQAYNDLGVVYENLGNEDSAVSSYERALEIDPKYLPAYTNLAFIYEKRGDTKKATFYWKRRYELGEAESHWWKVAREHLVSLGTYPRIKKEMAGRLLREVSFKRQREKEKLIEEARLHFDIANKAFLEEDYQSAMKEFETVIFLDSPDEELESKAEKLYKESEILLLKKQARTYVSDALDCINSSDYVSAADKLKKVLSTIADITQKE